MKQMDIFDFIQEPEPPEKEITAKCSTCKHHVWLHKGGRAIASCARYGTCEYEPKHTCNTCSHWRPYTHGWESEPVGYSCFGFGIAKSNSADKPACDTYEERID